MMLAMPELGAQAASERPLRPQRGMHRFEWSNTNGIEFHLSSGDRIRLLRERLRDRRPARAVSAARRHHELSLRYAGLGAGMAMRGSLEGAQAPLDRPWLRGSPLSHGTCRLWRQQRMEHCWASRQQQRRKAAPATNGEIQTSCADVTLQTGAPSLL